VFSWLAPKIHRNLFNPQSLIYHLTNSPPMRYSLVKVLLTVSPFAPSFFPQLNVFSQSFNSCSQARSAAAERLPRTHCSLFTFRHLSPLSTAFTQIEGVWRSRRDNSARDFLGALCVSAVNTFFSYYCALFRFFFPLRSFISNSLHALLQKHPGWGVPQGTLCGPVSLWRPISSSFVFITI
jgi:hypothetical protein